MPERWLVELEVARPEEAPRMEAEVVLNRLREWAADHPSRPIVGMDWERWTLEEAEGRVREVAAGGGCVILEETWLDRGVALRVAWDFP